MKVVGITEELRMVDRANQMKVLPVVYVGGKLFHKKAVRIYQPLPPYCYGWLVLNICHSRLAAVLLLNTQFFPRYFYSLHFLH